MIRSASWSRLRVGACLLVLFFGGLLFAGGLDAQEESPWSLSFEIENESALLAPGPDQEVTVDFSASALPEATRLILKVERVFPSAINDGGLERIPCDYKQITLTADAARRETLRFGSERGGPVAAGWYEIALSVSQGQHPKVRDALGPNAMFFECSRPVYAGNRREALAIVTEELNFGMETLAALAALYDSIDLNQAAALPEIKTPEDIQRELEEQQQREANGEAPVDSKPAPPAGTVTPDKGIAGIVEIGLRATRMKKQAMMPMAATAVELLANEMAARVQDCLTKKIQEAKNAQPEDEGADPAPLPALRPPTFDATVAAYEILMIKSYVLNLRFSLSQVTAVHGAAVDAADGAGDPRLAEDMRGEWRAEVDAAEASLRQVSETWLSADFRVANAARARAGGADSERYGQVLQDAAKFRLQWMDGDVAKACAEFISAAKEAHVYFAECLVEGKDAERLSLVDAARKQLAETDAALQSIVVAKGSSEDLQLEADRLKEASGN